MKVGGTLHSAIVLWLRVLGLCMRGSSSVVKLLGGRGAIMLVLSRRLMALCFCCCVVIACHLGSVCGVQARSSS